MFRRRRFRFGLEGVLDRFVDRFDADERHLCANALGELFEVRDIALGKDDRREARTLGGEYLLLDAANRQHFAS